MELQLKDAVEESIYEHPIFYQNKSSVTES